MKNIQNLYCVLDFFEELGSLIVSDNLSNVSFCNRRINGKKNFKLYITSPGYLHEDINNILPSNSKIVKIIKKINKVFKHHDSTNFVGTDQYSKAYGLLSNLEDIGIDVETFNESLPNILTGYNLYDIHVDRQKYRLEHNIPMAKIKQTQKIKNKI